MKITVITRLEENPYPRTFAQLLASEIRASYPEANVSVTASFNEVRYDFDLPGIGFPQQESVETHLSALCAHTQETLS